MITLWLAVAFGGDFDAVLPYVERAAGRELIDVPTVEVVEGSAGPEAGGHDAARYRASRGGILVFDEVVDGMRAHVPDDDFAPLVDCLVAHEVAHALQAQYVPAFDRGDGAVLAEGFATLVAHRACEAMHGAEAVARLEMAMGIDAPLAISPDNPIAAPYVYAPLWLAARERDEGWESVWSALGEPVPPDLAEAVAPLQVDGFPDRDAIVALVDRPGLYAVDAPSLAQMASQLTGGVVTDELMALPAAAGGYRVGSPTDGTLTLWALVATEPGGLVPWVAWRQGQIQAVAAGRAPVLPGFHVPARAEKLSVTFGEREVSMQATGYAELWVATDDHLVMAASRDDRDLDALRALVDDVLALLPEALPSTTWTAALDGPVAHEVPPGAADTWQVAYLKAAHRHIRGDYAGCVALIGDAHHDDPVLDARFRDLGHGCAVDGGDVAAADRYAAGDITQFHEGALVRHLELLIAADRAADAMALAERMAVPNDAILRDRAAALLDGACRHTRERKRCKAAAQRFR